MSVAGVVIAGGSSSRMGREKAFLDVGNTAIIARVIAVLAPHADLVVINANGDPQRFAPLDLPVICDVLEGRNTPLAGLHAGLAWAAAQGFDQIVTAAADTPFLPFDLVPRLARAAADHVAAIARSGGQGHFTTGLWRTALHPMLEHFLVNRGERQAERWVGAIDAAIVDWPVTPFDPFFNVNAPDDLAEAGRLAAQFGA
jgi:molybdopterin-guanine dinucleotide biosynthesis protein A